MIPMFPHPKKRYFRSKVEILTSAIYISASTDIFLADSIFFDRQFQWTLGGWGTPLALFALAAPFLFVLAAVVVPFNRRLSHILSLLAGSAALPWFGWLEWQLRRMGITSWIAFNLPDQGSTHALLSIVFNILAVGLIVMAVVCSVVRLIPERWTLRRSPVRERTWPALAACSLVLAAWFALSVTPYRIPLIVDRMWPELTVLHVEKRGIKFHETSVRAYRDGRVMVLRNDRRLVRYRFEERGVEGLAPNDVRSHVLDLLQLPAVQNADKSPANPLRAWNGEGWYILVGSQRVLAFTSENGVRPPPEVVDLFHLWETVEPIRRWNTQVADVCLGFCYGPLAGLGIQAMNDPYIQMQQPSPR
jgi:hypothetical protein